MQSLSIIALVLLTVVGYSAGVVLAAGRAVAPRLVEFLIVVLLWAGALAVRDELGKWRALAAGAGAALLLGLMAGHGLRRSALRQKGEALDGSWRRFTLDMGNFQGRLLMGLFYFVVLAPFALLSRARTDALRLRRPSMQGYWRPRTDEVLNLPGAKRQY